MAQDVHEPSPRAAEDRPAEDSSEDRPVQKAEPAALAAVTGPRPEEVARAATMILDAVAVRVVQWPAGVISFIGSLLAGAAVGAELWFLDPLNTTEFVTTVVVGATLALAGPLVVGVDRAGVRGLVKEFTEASRSPAEQASVEAEERVGRTLQGR